MQELTSDEIRFCVGTNQVRGSLHFHDKVGVVHFPRPNQNLLRFKLRRGVCKVAIWCFAAGGEAAEGSKEVGGPSRCCLYSQAVNEEPLTINSSSCSLMWPINRHSVVPPVTALPGVAARPAGAALSCSDVIKTKIWAASALGMLPAPTSPG